MEIQRKYHRRLGIPQERIAARLGMDRVTIHDHLAENAELKKSPNKLLTKGFSPNTIAEKLGISQEVVSDHLGKNAEFKNGVNAQLERGFGVNTIAEKLGWPEPLVWAVALEGKTDRERFGSLEWKIRPWMLAQGVRGA